MDPATDNNFPRYKDGDVAICINYSHTYKLHSSVLKRNSPVLAELLATPGAKLNLKARQERLAAYRLELVDGDTEKTGTFVRKDVSESGRAINSTFTHPDLDSDRLSQQQATYWHWLLGSFYGIQPALDDTNLATILSDCMGLVDVAEHIRSVDYVREIVDLALLRQDDILWQSIAGNPTAWAELGRRVHSPTIFKEGVCHIIGTWKSIDEQTKNNMNEDVRRVCEKKFAQLESAKETIEMRILGHYPTFLTRKAEDRPGRPSYANDIYMWMALSFFRQWFTQAISDGRTRHAEDGGYAFYKALSLGGQAYLHHEDFQTFHQYFPMSSKACNVLEANMGVLKEDVKVFVADVILSRVHLKPENNNCSWLTCAVIDKEDFPWSNQDDESRLGEIDPLANDMEDDSDDGDEDAANGVGLPVRSISRGVVSQDRFSDSLSAAQTDGFVGSDGDGLDADGEENEENLSEAYGDGDEDNDWK